jgi:hypothetical protein
MKCIVRDGVIEIRSQATGRLFGIYDPVLQTLSIRRSGETVQVPLIELMKSGEIPI